MTYPRPGVCEPAYVLIWRTPIMPAPAFWYFPGTVEGKRQAWIARRKWEREHLAKGESLTAR